MEFPPLLHETLRLLEGAGSPARPGNVPPGVLRRDGLLENHPRSVLPQDVQNVPGRKVRKVETERNIYFTTVNNGYKKVLHVVYNKNK